jgi:putative ABC transport system permease protein
MKFHIWLIRLLGATVPRRLRGDWRQEWEAELRYREETLDGWERLGWRSKGRLFLQSLGAFLDALWMQSNRWEDEMIQDIRFGIRMLLKHKGFTLATLTTLALGIAANTAIFSLVNGVLLKPLPFADPDRLVSVFENSREKKQDFVDLNAPAFLDWREHNNVFQDMAAYEQRGVDFTGNGEPARLFGVRASASLFPMLGVGPALGRTFRADEDSFGRHFVVIISHRLWRDRFDGAQDVLGKTMTLDGGLYTIVGVMPEGFNFLGANPGVWTPMAIEQWEIDSPGSHNYRAVARLKPGVTLAQAEAEMNLLAARMGQRFEVARGWGVTLTSLQEQFVGKTRRPLMILLGAVGFVLLIACANIANLLLARAASREREFAVRAALGAGRGRIVRQLLVESLLLAIGGAFLGWLMAAWAVASVVKFGDDLFPRIEDVGLDGRVMGFTLALTFLTGILFGLAPAWFASRASLNEALRDAAWGAAQGGRRRLRSGFVVVQIALAVVLLIGASLLLRSFVRLQSVDLGYRPDHVLTASIAMPDARFPGGEEQRKAFLLRVIDRVQALPGVEKASSVRGAPLGFLAARTAFYFEGRPMPKLNELDAAGYTQVSPGYFRTMESQVMRGRDFNSRDVINAPFVAVVNEAFVRAFSNGEEPLGRRLRIMDSHRSRTTEIVGVVHDLRERDPGAPALPEIYFPMMQRCWANAQLVVRTKGDPAALTSALQRAVAEIDPAQTLGFVRPLDSMLAGALAQRRLQAILLAAFAFVSLFLAGLGIYGVMAYLVTQRTHEIGVRMSLGAQKHQVLGLILRHGMSVAAIGVLAGLAGAAGLTRLMHSLLYEISPTDPLSFALIPLLLLGAAFLASWLPAKRAAGVDPLKALRQN